MDRKEFNRIVKAEGLDKYNISDSKESRGVANVIGIAEDSNGWVVFETDERSQYHVISRHSSEGECLEALLEALRDKKRVEEIMKKLKKSRGGCSRAFCAAEWPLVR